MAKKRATDENYLDKIPLRASLAWNTEGNGAVTLLIENTGWANRLAQILFHRPRVSHIHLDELGSFVWPLIDGETSLYDIGKQVEAHFGEAAQPLYERLSEFFRILESYHFISWKQA